MASETEQATEGEPELVAELALESVLRSEPELASSGRSAQASEPETLLRQERGSELDPESDMALGTEAGGGRGAGEVVRK